MFNPLRTDVMDRFTAVEAYFRATRTFKGDLSATARGLAFVQMYAAYEHTVCSLVQIAIDAIQAHGHSYSELRPSLLALFLDSQAKSMRDCGVKHIWDRRITLLETVLSDDLAVGDNSVLPKDGSHFKQTQLQLIFRVLGIKRLPARRRLHLFRIDEVVDHRNAIAHGRETAEDIGRRYTRATVFRAIRQVRSVCLLLISAVEHHCSVPAKHCR